MAKDVKELISKDEIHAKVKALAEQIKADHPNGVYCIVVLTGAMIFFVDLMKELRALGVQVGFAPMKLSSYEGTESTGKITVDLEVTKVKVEGKWVIIIEDIVDSGYTADFVRKYLLDRGAISVKLCSLLDKPERRKVEVAINYRGFVVPDKFIVGYGLDVDGMYRDLPYIGYIEE
ncbi:MAG: hypoxanthine phosphoribosyltransferase [DPANN group archaeon]|nr:hypoxanthine phosphoribosyltransferase [DPANN group archaeon]